MANILCNEKKAIVVSALAEGYSIRSIERMTGIHRDTIMRLGVSVGQACEAVAALASTSMIERANLTVRTHCKRLSRLTLASRKRRNFQAAIALHLAYYNLVKFHGTLRMTPAMAAGVEKSAWKVSDLVDAAK